VFKICIIHQQTSFKPIASLVRPTVWVKKSPLRLSDIFPKRSRIFSPDFTNLLNVPIYAWLQFFIQLSAILTKLCHIKRDHLVHTTYSKCPPSAETYAGIFWHYPQTAGNFWAQILHTYYTFLSMLYYRFFIQLYLQLWRSKYHIKYDHPACDSTDGGRFEHIMVVALNMA